MPPRRKRDGVYRRHMRTSSGATFGLAPGLTAKSFLVRPMEKQFSPEPASDVRPECPSASPRCGYCRNPTV